MDRSTKHIVSAIRTAENPRERVLVLVPKPRAKRVEPIKESPSIT
jgi:hypothetical protein